jgi:hypothetical protein
MTLPALAVLMLAFGATPANPAAPAEPAAEPHAAGLVPFVLPWDDASAGLTDLSGWLPKPAGKLGHVTVSEDGHLQEGSDRIRFFGVDSCFGASFPTKEAASAVSARMAKFGINCIRFHHMDTEAYPDGIRVRNTTNTRSLDPEALDRLDWLISQLKEHGIYSDLNLLVGRPFCAADGLPKEIEKLSWKERQSLGFFYAPLIELQKEYARELLTHQNPYTNSTYAKEPAVAFVEIVNEAGLMQAWLDGGLDDLPAVFRDDLQRQWDAWLVRRYGETPALSRAWNEGQQPLGKEMLRDGNFADGLGAWQLEQHEEARAQAAVAQTEGGTPAARVEVTHAGAEPWYTQLYQPGLKLEAGRAYTLTLRARAEKPCAIAVSLCQAHAPWNALGLSSELQLTTQWQQFQWTFNADGDENARVDLGDLARLVDTYWFADVSLKPGGVIGLGEHESPRDSSVPVFQHSHFGVRTEQAQKDWIEFLWDTERAYWLEMRDYIKRDLGVQSLVIGTIVGCSTPNLMAQLDVVDSHGYWQHPWFPGTPWDPQNWFINNISMVNQAGGVPASLAVERVRGRPFVCTEYNHPAPNTYSSEAPLLLAAVAGLQDWDAIFLFDYHGWRDNWDARRITGFFDIDQHPTKMANLPAAMALFMRGDIAPAKEEIAAPFSPETERNVIRRTGHAWRLADAGLLGLPAYAALEHRVGLDLAAPPQQKFSPIQPAEQPKRFVSDNGELTWDLTLPDKGVVLMNGRRSRAVIGFGDGRDFQLGDVGLQMGRTRQGWATVALTLMEGNSFAGPCRILVAATGYVENTDMGWKSAKKNTVGSDWGKAPSLVEVIPAAITLPAPADKVSLWALDERGQRAAKLPVEPHGSQAVFRIGPPSATLWYEAEVR